MRIYTRTGDTGRTSLLGGERVTKHHDRVEACGDIDELNAWLGVVLNHELDVASATELRHVQSDLFRIGARLSALNITQSDAENLVLSTERIAQLEKAIDALSATLPPLTAFILPGGSHAAAWIHVARSVCRRTERSVVRVLGSDDPDEDDAAVLRYLNRLSDYLFMVARACNHEQGVSEVEWHE